MLRRFWFPAMLGLVCTACAGQQPVNPPVIKAKAVVRPDGSQVQPQQDWAGPGARKIAFRRVQTSIQRGAIIGDAYLQPMRCYNDSKLLYDDDRKLLNTTAYGDIFFRVFSGHGYPVASNPNTLFREAEPESADYLVGANIVKVSGNLCRHIDPWYGHLLGTLSGTVLVTVNWQIYDVLQRRVILHREIEGKFQISDPLAGGYDVLIHQAFADAANRLAVDADLRALVSGGAGPVSPQADGKREMQQIPRQENFRMAFAAHADQVRAATVLVEVSEAGHGSGFIVRPDGLLITNHHVVGGQRFVRVRHLSGSVEVGEVLQRDRRRDVAVIKLPGNAYPVLPIREMPAQVGEEVYAVGAPHFTELGWTVTRGIISAVRPAMPPDRLDFIQADVAIHGGNSGGPLLDRHGNVVGIAALGWAADRRSPGMNTGLNGFIPILDGLRHLGLELVDAAEPRRRTDAGASR